MRPSSSSPAAAAATQSASSHDFGSVCPPGAVAQLLGLPFPPVPPLIGCEVGSFAHETITTRLPAIMDTVLDDIAAQAAEAVRPGGGDAQQAQQAQYDAAAAAVAAMQQEMPVDGPLLPLCVPPHLPASHPLTRIIPTTNAAVAAWQQHMAQQQQQQQQQQQAGSTAAAAAASWLGLPWLVVECYLYVRLATILAGQPLLASYDPFARQKAAALNKSMAAAGDVAAAAAALLQQQQAEVAAAGCGGQQQLAAHFSGSAKERLYQLLQYALWGNKTDLSLLVDVSQLDTSALAAVASSNSGAANSASANIIVDEFEALWDYLKTCASKPRRQGLGSSSTQGLGSSSSSGGDPQGLGCALPRIDIVLDNAGLELYTDLVLADYLVASGFSEVVVLHGKTLPWFVSDTLAADLEHLIETCAAAGCSSSSGSSGGSSAVAAAAGRWRAHLDAGRWVWRADEFWTTPHPYWWMESVAPALHADLCLSSLLIFKGDLNYRKLAGDCRWPPTTPFTTALSGFCPTGSLSLRTLKADVIAGLAPGEAEQLDKLDPRWQVNGRFGVVQFAQP